MVSRIAFRPPRVGLTLTRFRRLAEARKLDLTMEYQVLMPEFAPLFTDAERNTARARLLDHGPETAC